MSARTKRIERIVEIRTRAVDAASAEVARARVEADEAAAQVRAHAAAYGAAADVAASQRLATVAEFGERRAFVESLRERLERAREEVRVAEKRVEEKQRVLAEAKRELRKIEIWRDGLLAGERAEDDRKERLATDELAARVARREGEAES